MIDTFRLKLRIMEKKKTIQKLAPKVHLSAYTLGQQISNKKPMNIETAYILCDELDIADKDFSAFFMQK